MSDGGYLPAELQAELIKFITNNGKHRGYSFWFLRAAQRTRRTLKDCVRGDYELRHSIIYDPLRRLLIDGAGNHINIWKRATQNGPLMGSVKNDKPICIRNSFLWSGLVYDKELAHLIGITYDGKTMTTWDVTTQEELDAFQISPFARYLTPILYDPLTRSVIYTNHNEIILCDIGKRKVNATLNCNTTCNSLTYDPENHHLIVMHDLGYQIWDLHNKALIKTIQTDAARFSMNVAYDQARKQLFVPIGEEIKILDFANPEKDNKFRTNVRSAGQILYEPTCSRLFIAGERIEVLNIESKRKEALLWNTKHIQCFAYDPECKQLFAGHDDGIDIWDLEDREVKTWFANPINAAVLISAYKAQKNKKHEADPAQFAHLLVGLPEEMQNNIELLARSMK